MSDYERRRRNREYEYDWEDDRNSWQDQGRGGGRGYGSQGNYERGMRTGSSGMGRRWRYDEDDYDMPMTSARGEGSYGRGWRGSGDNMPDWRNYEDVGEYGSSQRGGMRRGRMSGGQSDYGRGSRTGDRNWEFGDDFGDYEGSYNRSGMSGSRNRNWGRGSDYEGDYSRGRSMTTGQSYGGSSWGQSDYDQDYDRRFGGSSYRQGQSGQRGYRSGGMSGQQGRYSGMGPQGYQRSDDRIREEINDRLTWHSEINATNIQVMVKSGEVTLEGQVEDRWQKRQAEDLADDVMGVKNVQNNLKVDQNIFQQIGESLSSIGQRQRDQSGQQGQQSGQSGQSGQTEQSGQRQRTTQTNNS